MISYPLAGLDKNSYKEINYDKIKEFTQDPDENPTLFPNRLMEAITNKPI
jgi:hypothetical protein